jgi:hypothetical protein
MAEAAQALRAAGLPDTMIRGAEEIFDSWAAYRDAPPDEFATLFTLLRHPADQTANNSGRL